MSLDDSDDEEDDELGNDDIREIYKQYQINARAFITLRFRHFSTFAIIMAAIATTAIVHLKDDSEQQFAAGVFWIPIIFLFWLLDFRTAEYLKHYISIANDIESALVAQ